MQHRFPLQEPQQRRARRPRTDSTGRASWRKSVPLEQVPGYLSVKEAAHLMGLSNRTVYGLVATGKLQASRIGSVIVVEEESVHRYQRRAPGRLRTRIPPWHMPPEKNLPFLTCITVRLRPGQGARLVEKLLEIRAAGKHLLPGTVARYIVRSRDCPDEVQIILVWRAAVMPPDEVREAALAALRNDLAEIVAWETARSTESQVIIHA